MSSTASLELSLKSTARLLGFDLVGIARAEPGRRSEFFREWLGRGYAGEMGYLERRVDERVDPRRLVPTARSALVLGLMYASPGESRSATPPGVGRIARYAAGEDYHPLVEDRLASLAAAIDALAGRAVASRTYVDTGPVLERGLAHAAGLGWIGKNTCLIDPTLGSYVFLAVIFLDLELAPDEPQPDHCGTCTACLDACPTGAFAAPYVLDARRCIAYTTIESQEGIPSELRAGHGAWIFGCDICQDVCPWNTRAKRPDLPDPLGLRARLAPPPPDDPADAAQLQTLAWLLGLDEVRWRDVTRGRAVRRAGFRGLLRNALVAAGNAREPSLRSALERHAAGEDPLLAEHARWALTQLDAG